jgi:hypothetical protein
MPIGDRLVDHYTFPGAPAGDLYANHHIPHVEGQSPEKYQRADAAPRVSPLRPYPSEDADIKRVWSVPGHEQFSYVIGMGKNQERGQFANPGWPLLGSGPDFFRRFIPGN